MKQITIKNLTMNNIYKCLDLKLAADQVKRVAPNVYSIAESKVNPLLTPYVIHLDDEVIGYSMRRNIGKHLQSDHFYAGYEQSELQRLYLSFLFGCCSLLNLLYYLQL